MTTPDWVVVTLKVIDAFDSLHVPYIIGGSAASIVYGIVRTTVDSDLIADLKPEHVEPLAAFLESEFYVDTESIREAIARCRSFNVIHQVTMFKVDVFIPKARTFEQAEFARRVEKVIARDPQRTAWIASAEDIILAKLEWLRMGGEVSERQWRDVLGVLKTQSGRLDVSYMRQMAPSLNVPDLLEKALKEAAQPE